MSITHVRVTWNQHFGARVLGLNPSSAAFLLCRLGNSVLLSGPQFLLQNDDINSISIMWWYEDPLCPTRKVTSTGEAQNRLSLSIGYHQYYYHHYYTPRIPVMAPSKCVPIGPQWRLAGLRLWDTENNLTMA